MSHTLSACMHRLARPLLMPHALMGSTSLPEQYNERRQFPERDQHVTFPSSLLVRASSRRKLKQPGWDHHSTTALPPCPDGNASRKSPTTWPAGQVGQQSLSPCALRSTARTNTCTKVSLTEKVPKGWNHSTLPGAYKDFLGTGAEPRHAGATNKGGSTMEHVADGLGGPWRGQGMA